MSAGIERRLERLLEALPEPMPEAGERALARALDALPARRVPSRRRLRTPALLFAAALALLALAAGALAAAGALHVSFGQLPHHSGQAHTTPAAARLGLPHGAHGIAVVVDGRLSLTTGGGLRLEGLPVTAAALSPHALYVAAGVGDSLVAMAPDGRRAWSRGTGGRVTAIGWAPDGLRIAYVVETGGSFRLHVIEGDGGRDRLIDTAVRPVTPSWRADSLALAYVGAGGEPVVYDLGHDSRTVVSAAQAQGATRLAFAPTGRTLAIGTGHGFTVAGGGAAANGFDFSPARAGGIGWLDGKLAVAVDPAYPGREDTVVRLFAVAHGLAEPLGSLVAPAPIAALDAHGGRLTVAVAAQAGVRVLSASPGLPTGKARLRQTETVLELARGNTVESLAVR
jgi:hypothetical protein